MAYQYESLNKREMEIRLIRLATGSSVKNNETVRCVLDRYSLDLSHPLPCVVISYWWGTSTERRQIDIGGRMLDVPASAEEVLRFALQTKGNSEYIWINAI
ncbi:hypothetical protein BCR34DRAFT_597210 [Clohesyomyces aquaticus]|uniref:Heterokaryon incompatibility domain-containing protein n=1 Tax=Clohesyomyces aquaticus TaxID=1231657 RepID=A0A1Y2A3S5_9PLEO|nr:hypothetical protein BCR34DRAFT_597210 [Clohesyomyces aquaticus]